MKDKEGMEKANDVRKKTNELKCVRKIESKNRSH